MPPYITSFLLLLLGAMPFLSHGYNERTLIKGHNDLNSIRHALKHAEIIDQVVDDFNPKCFVGTYYTKKNIPVVLGNVLETNKTTKKPSLRIFCPDMKETTGLTIALTDPDAPSREDPKLGEVCHWIAITSGYSLPLEETDNEVEIDIGDSKKDIIKYLSPAPPPKTGYHRYVFLLLEGPNSNLTAPQDRIHWGTGKKGHGARDWAKKEGLEVIGANFFYAKNNKQ